LNRGLTATIQPLFGKLGCVKGSKRRRRGRGKDQVWELRAYAGRSPVSGKPKYVYDRFTGTAKDADTALGELVDRVSTVDHTTEGETFGQYLDRWLPKMAILKELSPTTVREHKRTIEKNIKPTLGEVKLRELDTTMLNDLYVHLLSRKPPLAASSVRRVHSVITAALREAVNTKVIGENPALAATLPKAHPKRVTVPTPEEVQKVLDVAEADDPDMAAFFALGAVTGARRSELCGLRWGDVDWTNHTILIERALVVLGRGNLIYKATKTHSVRVLSTVAIAEDVLKGQKNRHAERAGELGIAVTSETPIFSYDLVEPMRPDTVTHYFKRVSLKVGLDTHFHALRHFAGTYMVSGGVDPRAAAYRLGHANPHTTLKTYAAPLPERDEDAGGVLAKALTAGAVKS